MAQITCSACGTANSKKRTECRHCHTPFNVGATQLAAPTPAQASEPVYTQVMEDAHVGEFAPAPATAASAPRIIPGPIPGGAFDNGQQQSKPWISNGLALSILGLIFALVCGFALWFALTSKSNAEQALEERNQARTAQAIAIANQTAVAATAVQSATDTAATAQALIGASQAQRNAQATAAAATAAAQATAVAEANAGAQKAALAAQAAQTQLNQVRAAQTAAAQTAIAQAATDQAATASAVAAAATQAAIPTATLTPAPKPTAVPQVRSYDPSGNWSAAATDNDHSPGLPATNKYAGTQNGCVYGKVVDKAGKGIPHILVHYAVGENQYAGVAGSDAKGNWAYCGGSGAWNLRVGKGGGAAYLTFRIFPGKQTFVTVTKES